MAEHRYNFPTKPLAASDATVSGPNYRFTVLTDGLLRYEWAPDGHFEDRASVFAINRAQPVPEFRHSEEGGQINIRTARFHLIYDGTAFTPNSLLIRVLGGLTHHQSEWRYGLPASGLGGTARTLDDVDGRLELGPGVVSRAGYAAIDDSDTMLFDAGGWIAPRRPGPGRVDGYLFAYGHDFKAAVRALYALSGSQPRVPRWMLGNWWSRYYAYSADEYLGLMDRFQTEGVPLSVAVVDMDWHWVHEERVRATGKSGWTGYSWNTVLFPDPEAFMKSLYDRGLKITMNDHPADGVAAYEDMYEDMAKAVGQDTGNRDPVDFDATSRKYMDAYFDIVQRQLQKNGMDFVWTDWQSGPYSKIPGIDPLWVLNHYTFLDNKVKNPHEPVLFSRFAGPGSHRYPVGFSGDAVVTWESLDFQPEFTATASNVGYGWWSHDIGGHIGGYKSDELMARWAQSGVFSPIMRLHSTANRWMSKEPWLYGDECRAAVVDIMRFRHRMLPYLFSMSVRAADEGEPLVQPVYWEWPKVDDAYRFRNTFFFGSALFVAPITQPRDPQSRRGEAKAWLPPGRYVDIFTGVVYEGDRVLSFYRPLGGVPVLAKAGVVIPLDAGDLSAHGVANPETLELLIVPGASSKSTMHERDGSKAMETKIESDYEFGTLELSGTGLQRPSRRWKVTALGCDVATTMRAIRGEGGTAIDSAYDKSEIGSSVSFSSADIGDRATLEFSHEGAFVQPQATTIDLLGKLERLVQDMNIRFAEKDMIWAAVSSGAPLAMVASRVEAIGLDEAVKGPVLELLLADPHGSLEASSH